jgi:hypothetical protein
MKLMNGREVDHEAIRGLFNELDRRHFGGCLGAAGYAIKLTPLRPDNLGQCISFQKIILVDPTQVEDDDELREVLRHEMCHAMCDRNGPSERAHGRRWRRVMTRLYLAGEWCVGMEHLIIRKIGNGSLPLPPGTEARYMLRPRRTGR